MDQKYKVLLEEKELEIYELKRKISEYESRLNTLSEDHGTKLSNERELIKLMETKIFSLYRKLRTWKDKYFFTKRNDLIYRNSKEIVNLIPYKSNLAIHHPDWMGVSNSTKDLFEHRLPLPEMHSKLLINKIADLIIDRQIKHVIFSGFAEGYLQLSRRLKELDYSIMISVFWHGNTTHMYENYSWQRHNEIIQLHQEGLLYRWGFAKKTMAELYAYAGFPSFFVKNAVNNRNLQVSQSKQRGISMQKDRVGIYASGETWNKNAFTQIAAVKLMGDFKIDALPCNDRMKEYANQIGVEICGFQGGVSRAELAERLTGNLINLYVTFSECAPLLPLESLSQGVPCLTGPNHHYFEENPILKQYLVVNEPDNPVEIARKALIAIDKREEIIQLYNSWALENDITSKKTVRLFLMGVRS
ncbi:hypothetical protein [Paenibacillus sp. 7541]|uniref:hypothetical protein n=1 Tax=Paenibacillus sp. 7541 TaxID=2026236 RepID=UPI000BA73DD5|nr:hypothetical protein [Paenibacillus sp. 7541]PAK52023.1 hypothetical protein CHH75_13410 [Paenibacillus sp. 7541]